MVFLTNRQISTILTKPQICTINAISYKDLSSIELPSGVVIDLQGNSQAINAVVSKKNTQYIPGSVEFNPGNTVYCFMDSSQTIIMLKF